MRRARGLAALLVVVSSFAGCTSGRHPQAATQSTTSSLQGWSRTDLHPVSQPVAVGNRFVLYVADGNALKVVALDVATGRTAWSDPATPSVNVPGQPPRLLVSGNDVIYYHDEGRGVGQLTAADAVTGSQIWSSRPALFSSWPSVCPTETTNVCVTGVEDPGSETISLLRFDAANGSLLSGPAISTSGNGIEVGFGLYADQGKHEQLMASSGSDIAWHVPLATVFPLAGASTGYGWNFDRIERDGLFVGTPGWPPTKNAMDLARTMTSAFSITDGSVAWRSAGTTFLCGILPCDGQLDSVLASDEAAFQGETVGVRMRATGTVFQVGKTQQRPATNVHVSLEGFDLATGKTEWSFAAGRNAALILGGTIPPVAGKSTIAIADAHGALQLLDLRTGDTQPATGETTLWCTGGLNLYKNSVLGSATDYVGGFAFFPCDTHQQRLSTPSTVPSFVGAAASGLVAWSDRNAVIAAPQESS